MRASMHTYERSSTGTLFGRTMMLLTGMLGITTFGSWLMWGVEPFSGVVTVALIVAIFGCLFWAMFAVKNESFTAVIPAAVFSFLWGIFLGPALASYTEILGPELVTQAFMGTIGLAAACGVVAYLTQIRFQKMEGFLMIGLFGLIIYGVVTYFTGVPSVEIDNGYCYIGIAIFIGFFLVDFARLKNSGKVPGSEGWGYASFMAIHLYLDMLNVFLLILRLMTNSRN